MLYSYNYLQSTNSTLAKSYDLARLRVRSPKSLETNVTNHSQGSLTTVDLESNDLTIPTAARLDHHNDLINQVSGKILEP